MKQDLSIARAVAAVALCGAVVAIGERNSSAAARAASQGSPVLVELFTSEGCSSCPPADALLESIDRTTAFNGSGAVVLSEHVDYWNTLGWTDPYSSAALSHRQRVYAERLHLESPYTPQMVIDGTQEFVGSDAPRAKAAVLQDASAQKTLVRVVPQSWGGDSGLRVRVEVDPLPESLQTSGADVYLAIALNDATSQVLHGENGGRRLHHVAVVRSLSVIGSMNRGDPFMKDVSIPMKDLPLKQLRLVAFVQEKGEGKVVGVAEHAAAP